MSSTRPSRPRPTEDGLIARYFAPLAGPGAYGLTDDAAILTPCAGHDLVLTADSVVAGVHFFPDDPPASIARKALGVNCSDLAAKGATPRGMLLTLALADDWTEDWLAGFAAGLAAALRDFNIPLLGGDTVRSGGPASIGVTALGEVPTGAMVRRMSAQVGDRLCVSGTIGDAALGLLLRREPMPAWGKVIGDDACAALVDRYWHPQPRLALAPVLRAHARAAMDVSDGFAGDLAKMLKGGTRSAEIRLADLPLSDAAGRVLAENPELMTAILTGGDDYEILCAVAPEHLDACLAESHGVGVPLSVVGTVIGSVEPPCFRAPNGSLLRFSSGSFSHF